MRRGLALGSAAILNTESRFVCGTYTRSVARYWFRFARRWSQNCIKFREKRAFFSFWLWSFGWLKPMVIVRNGWATTILSHAPESRIIFVNMWSTWMSGSIRWVSSGNPSFAANESHLTGQKCNPKNFQTGLPKSTAKHVYFGGNLRPHTAEYHTVPVS